MNEPVVGLTLCLSLLILMGFIGVCFIVAVDEIKEHIDEVLKP